MARDWWTSKATDQLLKEINELFPGRDKSSDGSIGDANHSARTSDHNPEPDGEVKARDFTHDPASGCNSYIIAEALRQSDDKRLKYIISSRGKFKANGNPQGYIWNPSVGNEWRLYNQQNPHNHHVHVSVLKHQDGRPWHLKELLSGMKIDQPPVTSVPTVKDVLAKTTGHKRPVLKQGSKGEDVKYLQRMLGITVDGDFGPKTKAAVVAYQKKIDIVADGIVGPYTWDHIEA